jgi:hypothetical protein
MEHKRVVRPHGKVALWGPHINVERKRIGNNQGKLGICT